MKFILEYPMPGANGRTGWTAGSAVARIAAAAEEAGFYAIAFSDHPAPSAKWLRSVGHETFDPFAALAFCAAVTTRLKLMTHLVVVPYRNPLLLAKSMATVDVLSEGRCLFGLGNGYLRSEFAALGVDMESRVDATRQALEVLGQVWAEQPLAYTGQTFMSVDQVSLPRPVQIPYPPVWFGGNSETALDNVVQWGSGWAPLMGTKLTARTTRTASLSTDAELGERIRVLRSKLAEAGRDHSAVDVLVSESAGTDVRTRSQGRRLEKLEDIGVTCFAPMFRAEALDNLVEMIERYGIDVIEPSIAEPSVRG